VRASYRVPVALAALVLPLLLIALDGVDSSAGLTGPNAVAAEQVTGAPAPRRRPWSPPPVVPGADPVPAIPDYPETPVFVPLKTERHLEITRATLTYRLVDDREVAGWGADLYAPRDSSAHDAAAPRGSVHVTDPVARPLIVMLPAGGFRTDLTASWAESFARAGFLALTLHRLPDAADEGIGHSLRGTAKTFCQDAINLRRVVDWSRTLAGVDPRRIGLLGVSRGAIATTLVAQTSPELSSVIVL